MTTERGAGKEPSGPLLSPAAFSVIGTLVAEGQASLAELTARASADPDAIRHVMSALVEDSLLEVDNVVVPTNYRVTPAGRAAFTEHLAWLEASVTARE